MEENQMNLFGEMVRNNKEKIKAVISASMANCQSNYLEEKLRNQRIKKDKLVDVLIVNKLEYMAEMKME